MATKTKSKIIDYKALNSAFNALPKEEQRVEIAKDVLKQLRTGKYQAESGI